jgi:PncC family amidohydrolase
MAHQTREEIIGDLLRRNRLWLATAESCSGGLLASRITDIPGSSDYFLGAVVAYANQVKIDQLGVSPATLEQFGAVSQEVVLEMALGVREKLHADIGLSVSGIAGPGGGSPEKPVGLVWIALSAAMKKAGGQPDFLAAWSYIWPGNRLEVKTQTADQALRLLLQYLQAPSPSGHVPPPLPPDPAS